ncbi:MAG: hypothetical protein MJE77_38735 [Proteobacteria bacterium]|nr:hypothetical protein [Pseudomonadota bacterium]
MSKANEVLERFLKWLSAQDDDPTVDKELLKDLVAYLQKQLQEGKSLEEVTSVLKAIERMLAAKTDDAAQGGSSTRRAKRKGGEETVEVVFELTIQLDGWPRDLIAKLMGGCAKLMHGCARCRSGLIAVKEGGPQ